MNPKKAISHQLTALSVILLIPKSAICILQSLGPGRVICGSAYYSIS
jgi:hypothetical protein